MTFHPFKVLLPVPPAPVEQQQAGVGWPHLTPANFADSDQAATVAVGATTDAHPSSASVVDHRELSVSANTAELWFSLVERLTP